MKRVVLIVEDEQPIAEIVELYLSQAGFGSRWAPDLATARKQLDDPAINLIVLDLSLPDGDGIDFFRELRKRRETPVVMVTARGEETDRVLGLELGADDYLSKPFSPRELVARIRAVLRRVDVAESRSAHVVIGDLEINGDSREVTVGGDAVELTRIEFDLLMFLGANIGRVYTRAQLLEAVWDYPDGLDTRTVDVHVAQLRRKLADACPIKTMRGVGYKA